MPEKRGYGQLCGLAVALDVLGERWTLLVVRELLPGPARFGDILANLPGMGPNQLSARLRSLTDAGVVEQQRTENDGRGRTYRLTPLGAQLRGPLLALAGWGLNLVSETTASSGESRAAWSCLAVEAMIQNRWPEPVDEQYEFRVSEEVVHIDVSSAQARVRRGPAPRPAMVASTDAETFVHIGARILDPMQAAASGRLTLTGEDAAIVRCLVLMGLDGSPAA